MKKEMGRLERRFYGDYLLRLVKMGKGFQDLLEVQISKCGSAVSVSDLENLQFLCERNLKIANLLWELHATANSESGVLPENK